MDLVKKIPLLPCLANNTLTPFATVTGSAESDRVGSLGSEHSSLGQQKTLLDWINALVSVGTVLFLLRCLHMFYFMIKIRYVMSSSTDNVRLTI